MHKRTKFHFGSSLTNRQNTKHYKFAERISFAEHGKLIAESSEFHLKLKRAHREHLFPTKKRDILSEKRESGIALKSVSYSTRLSNRSLLISVIFHLY